MKNMNVFTKTLFLLIAMGLGVLLHPDNTVASSTKSLDFTSMRAFEINALIMEINQKEGYVVVGEEKVYSIQFKMGETRYQTAFVNQRGRTSYINSLRTPLWQGQRVLVRGYKLPNGDVIGGIIKMMSSGSR
jgi:hypothetical protein